MDTTLEYVEMCRKAHEIQDAWKFERGDYFTTLMSTKHGHECCIVDTFWIDDQSRNIRPAPWVWLPLQDQLQDIAKDIDMVQFNNPLYSLQFEFDNFVMEHKRMPLFQKLTSFEQLWLCFVMHEKYAKVWDGAEWVDA